LAWPVATCGAEAWTYRKSEWKWCLAFETTGYGRVLRIPWTAKKTNDDVLREVGGRQLPGMLAARKLRYFSRVMRRSGDSLERDSVTGTAEGGRRTGRPSRSWMNDTLEWTELPR